MLILVKVLQNCGLNIGVKISRMETVSLLLIVYFVSNPFSVFVKYI